MDEKMSAEKPAKPDRTSRRSDRITYGSPDIGKILEEGFRPVDMHVHTSCSDAAPSVRKILDYAERKRVGFAITDHNEIRGVREIQGRHPGILVIPGIEIDCAEGPHILLYFYDERDLTDFFNRYIRERRRGAQYMTSYPATEQVMSAAEGYSCLKIAAHPFGYFFLDRGVLKCDARNLLPGVVSRLDGIEAICGGMTRKVNRMAMEYAEAFQVPVTGGSDAHILANIGSVVTGVRADDAGDFLDGIRKGGSIVTGSSSGLISRCMTAGVIGYHYLPYSVTLLHTRAGPHTARLRQTMRRFFRQR